MEGGLSGELRLVKPFLPSAPPPFLPFPPPFAAFRGTIRAQHTLLLGFVLCGSAAQPRPEKVGQEV